MADALGASCCNPALLARLGYADTSLKRLIFSRRFAERRSQDFLDSGFAWARGCSSLEQLQLGLKVSEVCASDSSNHLYFEYGGGLSLLEETKKLVHAAALFAQQHPRLRFHIDAHAGVGAPRGIATRTSRRRALSVVQEMAELGVEKEHCSTTAWGRRISSVWLEPESSTAARAELYFSLDGQEFPKRPEYYQPAKEKSDEKAESNLEGETRAAATAERSSDFSDSEDDDDQPHRRHNRMLAMLRALGFPVQGAFQDGHVVLLRRDDLQVPSDDNEPEEEDAAETADQSSDEL